MSSLQKNGSVKAEGRPVSEPRYSAAGLRAVPPTIAKVMTMALEKPGMLSLAAGFTDNATLPVEDVREALAEIIGKGGDSEFLQYGTNQGRLDLRRVLARRLFAQEPDLDAEGDLASRIVVTNGSQQALYLAMQVLCDPGDIVLVDRPSYFVFLEMLAGLGVRARSLPTDDAGALDVKGLERLLTKLRSDGEIRRVKAVYFISYFSNPSSRSMSEREKSDLAKVLARHDVIVPVVEDAAYRELYFEKPHEARSVMSLAAWKPFPCFYLSTLTKSFSTGMKIGYGVCSDQGWLERMLNVKGHHDFGTSNFAQALCERVLKNGAFDRQIGKLRKLYHRKMLALHQALQAQGLQEAGWKWSLPDGGLYLWLEAPASVDTGMSSAFCRACLDQGVLYVPGELCYGDEAPKNRLRLSFGVLGEPDLREAAQRFAAAARTLPT